MLGGQSDIPPGMDATQCLVLHRHFQSGPSTGFRLINSVLQDGKVTLRAASSVQEPSSFAFSILLTEGELLSSKTFIAKIRLGQEVQGLALTMGLREEAINPEYVEALTLGARNPTKWAFESGAKIVRAVDTREDKWCDTVTMAFVVDASRPAQYAFYRDGDAGFKPSFNALLCTSSDLEIVFKNFAGSEAVVYWVQLWKKALSQEDIVTCTDWMKALPSTSGPLGAQGTLDVAGLSSALPSSASTPARQPGAPSTPPASTTDSVATKLQSTPGGSGGAAEGQATSPPASPERSPELPPGWKTGVVYVVLSKRFTVEPVPLKAPAFEGRSLLSKDEPWVEIASNPISIEVSTLVYHSGKEKYLVVRVICSSNAKMVDQRVKQKAQGYYQELVRVKIAPDMEGVTEAGLKAVLQNTGTFPTNDNELPLSAKLIDKQGRSSALSTGLNATVNTLPVATLVGQVGYTRGEFSESTMEVSGKLVHWFDVQLQREEQEAVRWDHNLILVDGSVTYANWGVGRDGKLQELSANKAAVGNLTRMMQGTWSLRESYKNKLKLALEVEQVLCFAAAKKTGITGSRKLFKTKPVRIRKRFPIEVDTDLEQKLVWEESPGKLPFDRD